MVDMGFEEVCRRLDTIAAILRIAFRERIDEEVDNVRQDEVMERVLAMLDEGEVRSRHIQASAAQELDVSERTVRERLGQLLTRGFITRRRDGREIYYSKNDLIG